MSTVIMLLMWKCSFEKKMQECPLGTYKNVTGSSKSLCFPCPSGELPRRAVYTSVRGNSFYINYGVIYSISAT